MPISSSAKWWWSTGSGSSVNCVNVYCFAAGCVVIGVDVSPQANELARSAGVSLVVDLCDPEWKRRILDFTDKNGADATIICASSDSSEIINASMEITAP